LSFRSRSKTFGEDQSDSGGGKVNQVLPLLLSDFAPALVMGGIGEPVPRSLMTRPISFVCLPKKEHDHASNRANGIIHNGLFESNPAQGAFFGQEACISG
jgi:hypothetical protein